MSVPNRRKRTRKTEKSSLQILEEAFHLLRSVDLRYYWAFYAGAVPFVIGLLYFTADMSRSSLAGESILQSSFILVLLLFTMRAGQAIFSRGLWKTIQPESAMIENRRDWFRQFSALFVLQAFQIPLLLIGAFIALPLGWVIAFLQNLSVLAVSQPPSEKPLRDLFSRSLRHSHDDWAQNHAVLLIFVFVTFFTWINLVATCLILASFAKSFFGIEGIFSISPLAAIMNTTFALGSCLLTYLVVSPMLKAAYTLRCFYAGSRSSGADLLSRLAASKEMRTQVGGSDRLPVRAALVAVLMTLSFFSKAEAEEAPAAPAESSKILGEKISETLEQKKYQWQLSRRLDELSPEETERSWLAQQMIELGESIRGWAKAFSEWLEEMFDRFDRQEGKRTAPVNPDAKMFEGLSSALSIGLILLVAGLLTWLGFILYRKYRSADREEVEEAVSIETVDLASEDIVATQLPENEWMKLAREQMSKGDGRLAIRALFLASLANLGDEELLRIARFKSNRDYLRELSRKARKWESLRGAFAANTKLFERAWYGWHEVEEETVESFLGNHETIVNESKKAGRSRFQLANQATTV